MEKKTETDLVYLPAEDIIVNQTVVNIRKTPEEEGTIIKLANSILENGLLQPLVVCRTTDEDTKTEQWELVAGFRRLRAIEYLRRNVDVTAFEDGIPCVERLALSYEDIVFANGIENFQREDVNTVDICEWLHNLQAAGHTTTGLADRLGESSNWVSDRVNFWDLAGELLRSAVRTGEMSFHAGLELARRVPEAAKQDAWILQQRKNGEKMTKAKAEVANNPTKVPRPSQKAIEKMVATLCSDLADCPDCRQVDGAMLFGKWALGDITDEDFKILRADWLADMDAQDGASE